MIDTNLPLALSDGTPVTFVKITSKDRIQVRVPSEHALARQDDGGADPSLRIFKRDGTHFKNRTSLTLSNVAASAAAPAAPAPVAANDDTYYVDGVSFGTYDDAVSEALDTFSPGGSNVTIYKLVPVAVVGVTALAA